MNDTRDKLIKQLLDNQEKISRGKYEDKFSNLKTIKECLEDITKQLGLKELRKLINECKTTSNKNLIKNN